MEGSHHLIDTVIAMSTDTEVEIAIGTEEIGIETAMLRHLEIEAGEVESRVAIPTRGRVVGGMRVREGMTMTRICRRRRSSEMRNSTMGDEVAEEAEEVDGDRGRFLARRG